MSEPTTGPAASLILVVDDIPENRTLLRTLLLKNRYAVVEAGGGAEALDWVTRSRPELVILDLMMPGIDGFEVCRRLKEDPATRSIPVLILTSLDERQDRLSGIEAGADDFFTRPIDEQELMLRVRNSLRAKKLFDDLAQSLAEQRKLESLRDGLTHMLVHDLKSPLSYVLGSIDLVLDEDALSQVDRGCLERAKRGTIALRELIHSILDISRLENGQMPLKMAMHDARDLARDAVENAVGIPGKVTPHVVPRPDAVPVVCDASIVTRVIANLTSNAVKHTPVGGSIAVSVCDTGHGVRFAVTDTGSGIPPDLHKKIFEKYFQVESPQEGALYSTGLGLAFCRLAVEAHGGSIGVESEVGKGTSFWFELPST